MGISVPQDKVDKDGAAPAAAVVTFRLLEVFQSIADEGTMSAAAAKLGLSQAAISQAVNALELAFDARLIDRSVRPPVITLQGNTVLAYAREITAKMRELEDAMRYRRSRRVPLLRIGMLNSFASTAGAHVLDRLRDVADEWTVVSSYQATSFASLVDRLSDVVITSDETPVPDSVDATPFFKEPFVLAVPATWRGKPDDWQTLASKLDFIRYGRDSHMRSTIDGYLASNGIRPTRRYQFDTTDAALRMVAGGFGWTIMTPLILLKSIGDIRSVRIVPLSDSPICRTLRVAMRRGDGLSIAQRVLAESISTVCEFLMPQMEAFPTQVRKQVWVASPEQLQTDSISVGSVKNQEVLNES